MSSSGSGSVINYGSGSGSDFLTSYSSGSGSGSKSQKVTVPTVPVPVPVPQHCLLWVSKLQYHPAIHQVQHTSALQCLRGEICRSRRIKRQRAEAVRSSLPRCHPYYNEFRSSNPHTSESTDRSLGLMSIIQLLLALPVSSVS
jgi:hypothetical protein